MKKATLILTICFIILLIANIVHFINREWEASFYPASYATLYYPTDIPTITRWEKLDQTTLKLLVNLSQEVEGWRVTDSEGNTQYSEGADPVIQIRKIDRELQSFTLTPVPDNKQIKIDFTLRFYSREFYQKGGMDRPDVYIIKAGVPCGEFNQYSLSDWVDDYAYVGEEGLAEVDRILRDEVKIEPDEPTFSRMEKLTSFLRKKLINARGIPKNDLRWMNPWLIYSEMLEGTAKGWCTQHGQIWVFFANRAGIPTRLMQGARTQDNTFVYTGHTWAESWIAEQNRWAFVDLSHSLIYITDKNENVLNSADLFHLNQHNAFDSVTACIYKDWEWEKLQVPADEDSVISVPFVQCNNVVRKEFTAHSILKIRRPPNVEDVRTIYTGFRKDFTFLWANLERYLFKPPLSYSYYPTEGKRTYYVRWGLFYGMIVSLVLAVVACILKR